jgi:hypothetical protein
MTNDINNSCDTKLKPHQIYKVFQEQKIKNRPGEEVFRGHQLSRGHCSVGRSSALSEDNAWLQTGKWETFREAFSLLTSTVLDVFSVYMMLIKYIFCRQGDRYRFEEIAPRSKVKERSM